jgi:hypothetical protein
VATVLSLAPQSVDIVVSRGDSTPWTFTVQDSAGAPVDITGFTLRLTVDPEPDPLTNTNNLFQLTGTLTDPVNGVVQFGLTTVQSNQIPAVYYFDLQMTDGGGRIRTIAKGKFEIRQDITK